MLVSTILSEIISETVSDLTTTQMLVYLKSAARQCPALIRDQLFIATDTLTITQGTKTGDLTDLSPTFLREKFVWYVDSDGNRQPIYKPKSGQAFHNNPSATDTGKPEEYMIYGQTIEVDRLADADLTVGFKYFAALTDSIGLSTDLAINEGMAEAIKFLTKAEYYEQYEEDTKKADKAERKGLRLLEKFEEEYQINALNDQVEDTESY